VSNSQQDLREVLRLSKLVDGHNVRPRQESDRTLTEADLEAISVAVVIALKGEIKDTANALIWEGIRKLMVTGIVGLFTFEQVMRFLK
jgi:hypothetical protein